MISNRCRLAGFVSGLLLLAAPAFAVELDIAGDYGNEAGCRHARTNDYSEDDMVLLTRRNVSTYVTMCSYVQIFPAEAESQVMIVTCGHEGEDFTTLGLMRVQKVRDGMDAYLVFDEAGTLWGKVGRCS